MQWHVHKGNGGPVLAQYRLGDGQQLELWVDAAGIAEGGFIVNEIFGDNEYLQHGVTLKPGDTVVDIGANIGVFGARVLSAVPGGDVHYYAVEPCPSTFKLLQQNLLGSDGEGQQNSFFHINEALSAPLQAAAADRSCPQYPANVRLLQTAVSSAAGSDIMTFFPYMPGNSTMRVEEKQQLQGGITPAKFLEGAQTLQVAVTTLPQLFADLSLTGHISLLKIDVEGEELEVLRGLDEASWSRIQQVAVEVHDCIDGQPQAAAASPLQERQQQAAAVASSQQQQQQPQASSAAAAAQPADVNSSRFPRYQALMTRLPGPRTAKDIDGVRISYHPLPIKPPGAEPSQMDPAVLAALAQTQLPPPRDEGRVMAVARLLRDQGFTVVMECPLGLPLNYTVYAVRQQ